MTDTWHRIDDVRYAAPADEFGDPTGVGRVELTHHEYRVISLTPKGAWLDVGGSRRFARTCARKRFACSTYEEAIVSFKARKTRQLSILASIVERVREALSMADGQISQDFVTHALLCSSKLRDAAAATEQNKTPNNAPKHGPFYHLSQHDKDYCKVCS